MVGDRASRRILMPMVLAAVLLAALAGPAPAQHADDACPHGWSSEESVWFGPPRIDSGVTNPERADGCTLLDVIWGAEPFTSRGSFVRTVGDATRDFVRDGLLTARERAGIIRAAARTDVGGPRDDSIPNTCDDRLAIQFDDGPSFYRTGTLEVLRDKQVTGVFMDTGMRVEANPHIARFQLDEGHLLLNHTYNHANLNDAFSEGGADAVVREVLDTEAAFAAAGAPISFKGIRPPFGAANAQVQEVLADLGYTAYLTRIGTDDWIPQRTPEEISDAIVEQLYPGAIISLHDGPFDTVAGPSVVEGLALLIDAARDAGYCFGKVDHHGGVVADRHVPSDEPVPTVTNPVPYHELLFGGGLPPEPYVIVPPPVFD